MNCIIVDDEPIAREGIMLLLDGIPELVVTGSFGNTAAAHRFMGTNEVGLIFLDIHMPGTNGIEFARSLPGDALVIFTTAYSEFALDSYDVDAVDYIVKPIKPERFRRAVDKALTYAGLLKQVNTTDRVDNIADDYFFVKADRRVIRLSFAEVLFVEGLKDYVVIHTGDQKIITAMNIKTIYDQLPQHMFVRVSKSYIINVRHITSFDNNMVYIQKHEIPVGNAYREAFFSDFVNVRMLGR